MIHGMELSEAWWLKAGREGLSLGKFFGSSLYYMNMKNRFGWAEKMKTDLGEETLKGLQDAIVGIATNSIVTKRTTHDRNEELKQALRKVKKLAK